MGKKLLENILLFVKWLDSYGEVSQDHQDFYAGTIGRAAKALYYHKPILGMAAVLPMVICEAFFPRARKYFYPPMRLPIADAHYAMGFALLFKITKEEKYYNRAVHFLEVLKDTRCPGYRHYAWGYPFHWQTRSGLIKAGTPLITTTPYCYEAFDYVYRIDGEKDWRAIMESIANHVFEDYRDFEAGPNARTCTYTPLEKEGGVINASAYRAFLLTKAWREFEEKKYWEYETFIKKSEGNLGILIGANGGIFAIRKNLFSEIPTDKPVTDDFYLSLSVIKKGYKFIYESLAIGFEEVAKDLSSEFKRKIRFAATNFQTISFFKSLLFNKNIILSYAFWSHKIIRWFLPLILILVFVLNIFLVNAGTFYLVTFIIQLFFYFLALIGFIFNKIKIRLTLLSLINYFLVTNIALLIGFIRFLRKKHSVIWQSTSR